MNHTYVVADEEVHLKSTDKSFNKTQGCKEPVSLSGKD